MKPETIDEADIVIDGAGAAGLFAALSLAPENVIVLNEGKAASAWAQGGIAAAVAPEDSAASHAEDTINAAAGVADASAARVLTAEASHCIRALEKCGVRFDRGTDGAYKLSREAGHTRRRVL